MYAKVMFENQFYNYETDVNKNLSAEEVKNYFVGKTFNMGVEKDDLQTCINCEIIK